MTRIPLALCALLGVANQTHAAAIQLSGTVTDRAGKGISGVGVTLTQEGISVTTSTDGVWSLTGISGVGERNPSHVVPRWSGRALEVVLVAPSDLEIEAFNLQGASRGRLAYLHLDAGAHSIPLALPTIGMTWLRVKVNGRSEAFLVGTGFVGTVAKTNGLVDAVRSQAFGTPVAGRLFAKTDTVRITWKSKVVARIPIGNLDTSGIEVNIDTLTSIPWNDTVSTYGSLYDARDGRVYRTVKIGEQVWMAENLNYKVDSSWWFTGCQSTNENDSCKLLDENLTRGALYGRCYTWAALMGLPAGCDTSFCLTPDSCKTKSCPFSAYPPSRGVCPVGWHVPSYVEWTILLDRVVRDGHVGSGNGGLALRATSGWKFYSPSSGGLDLFGFRGLPAGIGGSRSFGLDYQYGYWWSSKEVGRSDSWEMDMSCSGMAGSETHQKELGLSARCLKD